MKTVRLFLFILSGFVVFSSCQDDDANLTPHITSVQRDVAPGDVCAVTGYHFGDDPGAVVVSFGGIPVEVIAVYDFSIHVYSPFTTDPEGTEVRVSVSGRQSNPVRFVPGDPQITLSSLVEPDGRSIGGFGYDLVIRGGGFHPDPQMNEVTFDGVETEVKQASRTSLTVTIPAPASFDQTETDVVVRNKLTGVTTDPRTFAYNRNACDSMRVAIAPWIRETLRPGVELRKAVFTMFAADSLQEIYIIEAALSPENRIGIGFPGPALADLTRTSVQAAAANAYAAINAGYFTNSGGVITEFPYVRINGVEKQVGATGNSKTFRSAALTFDGDGYGNVRIRLTGTSDQNAKAQELTDANILVAGPLLVSDNKLNTDIPGAESTTHNVTAHPRTALGKIDDGSDHGKIVFVAVDGRLGTGTGMSNFQLQRFMRYLGAQHAMCLDGGGSTTMYIKERGVINTPSDGSERAVQTTVMLF